MTNPTSGDFAFEPFDPSEISDNPKLSGLESENHNNGPQGQSVEVIKVDAKPGVFWTVRKKRVLSVIVAIIGIGIVLIPVVGQLLAFSTRLYIGGGFLVAMAIALRRSADKQEKKAEEALLQNFMEVGPKPG